MARTPLTWRRLAATAALGALSFGFALPGAASDQAVSSSADGLERAAEARGDDDRDQDDGGDDTITPQGIAWK